MSYVDGMVCAVPAAKREAYVAYAKRAVPIFRDLGATGVNDCWGDSVPDGEITSFPMAVRKKADEVVVFSWITWPSREVRNAAWEKIEADPEIFQPMGEMPFDGKRMIFGAFDMIVEG